MEILLLVNGSLNKLKVIKMTNKKPRDLDLETEDDLLETEKGRKF